MRERVKGEGIRAYIQRDIEEGRVKYLSATKQEVDNFFDMITGNTEPTIMELKEMLSQEWNKPKAQNIKRKDDHREARSYRRIKELQLEINKMKYE